MSAAQMILAENSDDINQRRDNLANNYMQVAGFLNKLAAPQQMMALNAGTCDTVPKELWGDYAAEQEEQMFANIPSGANPERVQKARTKVNKILKTFKTLKAGDRFVELIDLNFEIGATQVMAGWALAMCKGHNEIHFAFAEAGFAWVMRADYALETEKLGHPQLAGKVKDYIEVQAYNNLLMNLGGL
mmetsp:Transcript_135388/g.270178  ORF Transcript_135388/g.270178 Transcript_135388/m.270178 type:complete len:188 (+) Transcript_135388:76-639(+)